MTKGQDRLKQEISRPTPISSTLRGTIPILIGIILGMLLAILSERKYMHVLGVILILASVTIFFGMVV